jgi:hypothetical protein
MTSSDRRRVQLALLVTTIALPVVWLTQRPSNASTPTANDGLAAPPTTAYEPEVPVFIDSRPPNIPPAAVEVQVLPVPDGQQAEGRANYRRLRSNAGRVCSTPLVPVDAELSVYNIDNGRQIVCRNIGEVTMPANTDIVIDTELFGMLGDLTDAPFTVRITW